MYKKSNVGKIISLLLFFALFLSGCTANGTFGKAAELYEAGDYKAAEEQFELAIEQDPDNEELRVGHGFNLAMLGRSAEAIDELFPIYDSRELSGVSSDKDIEFVYDVGDVLIDLYMEEGNSVNAAYISDRLIDYARSTDEKEKYELKSARAYAELYKDNILYEDAYRKALSVIIDLSVYAGEEYEELVNSYRTGGDYKGMLAAADNMIIYMRGRSAHIDNFPSAIGVILDAAEAAGYVEWDKTPQDYYAAAQEFITLAGDKGLTYEQKLRYKIVIAERMRQKDVAIRLLGVYLNHCEDDRKAIKEKLFLENRF